MLCGCQVAQDLRQIARTELAGSAGAVAVAGQPFRLCTHRVLLRRRSAGHEPCRARSSAAAVLIDLNFAAATAGGLRLRSANVPNPQSGLRKILSGSK